MVQNLIQEQLTLNWENLDSRRDYLKSIFIDKILNNLTAPNLNCLLIKTSDRSTV